MTLQVDPLEEKMFLASPVSKSEFGLTEFDLKSRKLNVVGSIDIPLANWTELGGVSGGIDYDKKLLYFVLTGVRVYSDVFVVDYDANIVMVMKNPVNVSGLLYDPIKKFMYGIGGGVVYRVDNDKFVQHSVIGESLQLDGIEMAIDGNTIYAELSTDAMWMQGHKVITGFDAHSGKILSKMECSWRPTNTTCPWRGFTLGK